MTDPTIELAVGVGFRPGTPAETLVTAIRTALGTARIHCLATIDRRAADPQFLAAAHELGVATVAFAAAELNQIPVPTPAARTVAAVGTPSVAEAAALAAAGSAELLFAKRVIRGVTIAAAPVRPA
ncbi:cobalamin biosynthesis protein [Nocardia sp. NPDC003482]